MQLHQPSTVSVVIPAYNAGPYIGRTLTSALAQTYRNLEIIVVDDGSKDETAAVIREFMNRDERVTLIQQENQGVAAARNRAIAASHGAWVAPLDADDRWHPENLERKVRRSAEVSEAVGIIYSGSILIDADDQPICEQVTYGLEGNVLLPLLLENFLFNGSTPLVRRTCFQDAGYHTGFHQAKAQGCEDWDFYLQVAFRHPFAAVREPLVYYRRTPGSLSADAATMARSYRFMMRRHRSACPQFALAHLKRASSNFHFNLANQAYRSNAPFTSILLHLRAVTADPARMIRSRRTYKSCAKFLLSFLGLHSLSVALAHKPTLEKQCRIELK